MPKNIRKGQSVPLRAPLASNAPKPVHVALRGRYAIVETLTPQAVTPAIARWLEDPAVMEGLNAPSASMGLDAFRIYVGSFDQVRRNLMLIRKTSDGQPAGLIFMEVDLRHRLAAIHVVVGSSSERNRGYAFAAGVMLADHAFTARRIEKVTFQPLERNSAAIAVCEKSPLVLEGILRSHRIDGRTGERLDQRIYGATRADHAASIGRYARLLESPERAQKR